MCDAHIPKYTASYPVPEDSRPCNLSYRHLTSNRSANCSRLVATFYLPTLSGRSGLHANKTATLRDVAHRLDKGVLYLQNVTRFCWYRCPRSSTCTRRHDLPSAGFVGTGVHAVQFAPAGTPFPQPDLLVQVSTQFNLHPQARPYLSRFSRNSRRLHSIMFRSRKPNFTQIGNQMRNAPADVHLRPEVPPSLS
jgi:hypothetical protein